MNYNDVIDNAIDTSIVLKNLKESILTHYEFGRQIMKLTALYIIFLLFLLIVYFGIGLWMGMLIR
jgi:hypothetical protein